MKKKELIQLVIASIILVVSGIVVFNVAFPKKTSSKKGTEVEKITSLPDGINSESVKNVSDPGKFKDFYLPPDLKRGLNNTQPFAPVR